MGTKKLPVLKGATTVGLEWIGPERRSAKKDFAASAFHQLAMQNPAPKGAKLEAVKKHFKGMAELANECADIIYGTEQPTNQEGKTV
jgi:hypothetical protein